MSENNLPHIPNKKYFAIGEASRLCDVKPHVLRYWEQEFEDLRKISRRSNRRYYENRHILLIRRIRSLLYDHGYTIDGAKKLLADEGKSLKIKDSDKQGIEAPYSIKKELKPIADELESILKDLRTMA